MTKISEVKHNNPYAFAYCMECNEIFENDTGEDFVYCHKHNPPSMMMNFLSIEDIETYKNNHGIKNDVT